MFGSACGGRRRRRDRRRGDWSVLTNRQIGSSLAAVDAGAVAVGLERACVDRPQPGRERGLAALGRRSRARRGVTARRSARSSTHSASPVDQPAREERAKISTSSAGAGVVARDHRGRSSGRRRRSSARRRRHERDREQVEEAATAAARRPASAPRPGTAAARAARASATVSTANAGHCQAPRNRQRSRRHRIGLDHRQRQA